MSLPGTGWWVVCTSPTVDPPTHQPLPPHPNPSLIGEIIARFEKRGYQLVALKMISPSKEHIEEHYKDLAGKPFFPKLVAYMTSGPVVCMVWQGGDAVRQGRAMLGATNPLESAAGTIRGDFCIDVGGVEAFR